MIETKTLVIGFGFSTLPLYRELDRTGEEYLIISDPDPKPIWKTLKDGGNLDFDLVSSYHTSFYSFNIVKDFKTDYYTPAKEYYDMHLSFYDEYKDKIIGDYVTKIENYEGYSIVHTQSGQKYKATNVVIAVNFIRKILSPVATFDFSITNKTIVFNMIGDSVNLMIAKLIAGNNRIIILSDGFMALDKMFVHNKKTFTLDQIEFHNFAKYLPKRYFNLILAHPILRRIMVWRALKKKNVKFAGLMEKIYLFLGNVFAKNTFQISYPDTIRAYDMSPDKLKKVIPFENGFIIIKYWPIEGYSSLYGNDIAAAIDKGYLLNDLPFFIDQGYVECYKKSDTVVNKDDKNITYDGKIIPYDYFVEGSAEFPNLPEIVIKRPNNEDELYHYVVREAYFGTVPKKLSNIFLLGYMRPSTGGLGNLTEMQCLLTHKMIANDTFKQQILSNLESRIDNYNETHYSGHNVGPSDHLVHYGFFTDDIAKVIGIDIKLSDCKSFSDYMKYLFVPNNAFKYRQSGEYKVEGCDRLVDFIYNEHDQFRIVLLITIALWSYVSMIFIFFTRIFLMGYIGWPVLAIVAFLLYQFNYLLLYYTVITLPLCTSAYTYIRFAYIVTGVICTLVFNPFIFIPIMTIDLMWTFIVRQINPLRAKHIFNDLKVKRRYVSFFNEYLKVFRAKRLKNMKM